MSNYEDVGQAYLDSIKARREREERAFEQVDETNRLLRLIGESLQRIELHMRAVAKLDGDR